MWKVVQQFDCSVRSLCRDLLTTGSCTRPVRLMCKEFISGIHIFYIYIYIHVLYIVYTFIVLIYTTCINLLHVSSMSRPGCLFAHNVEDVCCFGWVHRFIGLSGHFFTPKWRSFAPPTSSTRHPCAVVHSVHSVHSDMQCSECMNIVHGKDKDMRRALPTVSSDKTLTSHTYNYTIYLYNMICSAHGFLRFQAEPKSWLRLLLPRVLFSAIYHTFHT